MLVFVILISFLKTFNKNQTKPISLKIKADQIFWGFSFFSVYFIKLLKYKNLLLN